VLDESNLSVLSKQSCSHAELNPRMIELLQKSCCIILSLKETWRYKFQIWLNLSALKNPDDLSTSFAAISAAISVFLSGGIRTKTGRCSYYGTLKLEKSSHFLILAAFKK
jgi:hypothetical protein